MRVDRPERWKSYEKMIEGALLGGSEGRETDGVRVEWEEGFKDPATGCDRDGLVLQADD